MTFVCAIDRVRIHASCSLFEYLDSHSSPGQNFFTRVGAMLTREAGVGVPLLPGAYRVVSLFVLITSGLSTFEAN